MANTTTPTEQPLTLAVLETQPCRRCGGTGHHSYCQKYGTTCFECMGKKVAYSAKAKPFAAEIAALQKAVREVMVKDSIGATVAYTPGKPFLQSQRLKGDVWVVVTDVVELSDEKPTSWRTRMVDGAKEEYDHTYPYMVHFTSVDDDGSDAFAPCRSSVRCAAGNSVLRGFWNIASNAAAQEILSRYVATHGAAGM